MNEEEKKDDTTKVDATAAQDYQPEEGVKENQD